MSRRPRVAVLMTVAALGLLGGACTGGATSPAWIAAPSPPPAPASSAPVASTPGPSPSDGAPGTPGPSASVPAAGPTLLPTGAGYEGGLTDREFAVLTQGTFSRNVAVDPPPPLSVKDAERIVRERFPGDRPLVWAGLVASEGSSLVGWMIVLGVASGQPCDLHPGLLERAFEGGIVHGGTGQIDYMFVCG